MDLGIKTDDSVTEANKVSKVRFKLYVGAYF